MYNKLFNKISLSLIAAVLFFSSIPLTANALEKNEEVEVIEEEIVSEEEIDTEEIIEEGENDEIFEETVDEDTTESNNSKENIITPMNDEDPVIVDLEHDATFRTYTNIYTGATIPLFNLIVNFSINEDDLEGVKVEIPLDGYVVGNSKNTVFDNFTTQGSIFTLQPFTPPDPTSTMFKSVVYDGINNKIIVELNKTESGVQNLTFRFKFNEDFDSIIPGSQVIWENMHANVHVPSEDETFVYSSGNLTSISNKTYTTELRRTVPVDEKYTGGSMSLRTFMYSNYYEFHKTDFANYENKIYYEVPQGTTISGVKDFVDLNNPVTPNENSNIPEGYVRFYGTFMSDEQFGGSTNPDTPWTTYNNRNFSVTPDLTGYSIGDTFKIKLGVEFKKYNDEARTVVNEQEYIVSEKEEWSLLGTGEHNTGTAVEPTVIVNIENPNFVSRHATIFGWTEYGHGWTIKNEGSKAIKGVRYEVYNAKDDYRKLNFNSIQIFAMTKESSVATPSYEVIYDIAHIDGSNRTETTGIINNSPQKIHTPPVLQSNEYIAKITLVPVKSDGSERNMLQPQTAFSLRYTSKNWKDNVFPDGTEVNRTALTEIPIGGTMFFDDADGMADSIEMPTFNTQMGRDIIVDAGISVISSNSKQKSPGSLIDYTIQGNVGNQSFSDYRQPEITIGIPIELELVDTHLPKNFEDVKNEITYDDSVSVELVSSDSKYNYYKFITDNTGYKNGGLPSFNIPIQVKVKDGALAGEYKFNGIFLSSYGGDFLQLTYKVNNASESMATKYGHTNNDENYKYTYFGGNNAESATVEAQTRIGARGAARAISTDQWTDVKGFAVEPNSNPETLSSIVNSGNTRFSDVKLYNILPYNNDSNNSTGTIEFTGIDAVDNPTIWYTTVDPQTLPAYGGNLQNWDDAYLTSIGFSKIVPAMDQVTAVFIDYGNAVIEPGKSFDTIMKFHVPNESNQTAYTRFQYSYEELDSTSAPVSPVSDIYMLSTESFSIVYDENLPSYLLEGITAAEHIPENQSTMLDVSRNGSITLDTNGGVKPSLPGYKFTGWKLQGGTKVYQPGETVNYVDPDPQNITLEAQWDEDDSTLKLFKNIDADNDTVVLSENHKFGSIVDFTAFPDQSRLGYDFKGWSDRRQGGTILGNDYKVNFINEKWFYANWDAHSYTVEYYSNDETETMTAQPRKYDDKVQLKNNEFVKEGHTFIGWSTDKDATALEYTENSTVNLTDVDGATIKLYPVWKQNTYTVQFDLQGGLGTAADVTKTYADNLLLPTTGITKKGYKFEGWSKTENATTADFTTVLDEDLHTVQDEKVTLYAAWSPVTYTVKFDLQGGTGTATDGTKTYADNLDLPTTGITKDGYTFVGWAKEAGKTTANYTTQLTEDLKDTQDDELTLYAAWAPVSYTVKFDLQGGTGTATDETKTYAENLDLPTTGFTKTGYKFEGWSSTAGTKVAEYTTQLTADLKDTQDDELVLYAAWSPVTYNVKFDLQGGTGTAADGTKTYADNLALPTTGITKDGYTFVGWAKAAGKTVADYTTQLTEDLKENQDDEVTLYAVWLGDNYTIEFDVDGANETVADITKVFGTDIDLPTTVLTKEGYEFLGWATEADQDTADYAAGATLDTDLDIVGGKATLYAVWKANTYSVELDARGANETVADFNKVYGVDHALPVGLTKLGYEFLGWSADATSETAEYTAELDEDLRSETTDELTLYAVWKANTYSVELDARGANETVADFDKVYGTNHDLPVGLTKLGYEFLGWSEDATSATAEFTAELDEDLRSETTDELTLYAVWKANTYTVKLDARGANETVADFDKVYEVDHALPEDLTKLGYEFLGWTDEATSTTAKYTDVFGEDLETEADEEVTLYAVWKANTYTVKFEGNGANETIADKTKTYDTNLVLPTVTKDGYTFVGWSADATATTAEYVAAYDEDLKSDQDDELTLYAVWTVNTYTVQFDANGGLGEMDDLSLTYDVKVKLPEAKFTNDGYEFAGWSTTADGSVEYANEAEVSNLVSTGNVTLFAVWTANEYEIDLDAEDIEFHISDLNKAITSKTLDAEIVRLSGAKGYKVNADGTKEELPVFVYNADALYDAKVGDNVEVTLSLLDPQTAMSRAFNPKTDANANIKVVVSADKKIDDKDDKKDDKKDPKDPSTGIESANPIVYTFLITFAALVLAILFKKKRQQDY